MIVFFCVIILPILVYQLYSFQASLQFKEYPPPKNTADSLKSLVASLIQNEELFAGNVNVTYVDPNRNGLWNKAQITLLNTAIADDSIGPIEYIAIAEKKGEVWSVVEYKRHAKCKRHIILKFWTTSPCI